MLILIIGGSGSGKSEYAESVVTSLAGRDALPLYYIATMRPFGEEGRRRVERHRRLRAGKGFETIECYTNLKEQCLPEKGVVLLECMSNLVANEIFEPEGAHERTVEAVTAGIEALKKRCRHLVIVTNDIFSDGIFYEEETRQYQKKLGMINCRLAALSDAAVEVVAGIPLPIKGEEALL